jgi:hypothetical protein
MSVSHAAAGASKPFELRDQRRQRIGTLAALARNDVLPAAQEAHESPAS